MQGDVQEQGSQLREAELVYIHFEETLADAKSNVQSLAASKPALQCEVQQFPLRAERLANKVARMRQDADCELENVHSDFDSLQVRLDATVSHLLGIRTPLTAGRELFEEHHATRYPVICWMSDCCRLWCLISSMGSPIW